MTVQSKELINKNSILLITSIAVSCTFVSELFFGGLNWSVLSFLYVLGIWWVAAKNQLWADLMLLVYLVFSLIKIVPFLSLFNVQLSFTIMNVEILPAGLVVGLFVTSDGLADEVRSWLGTPEEEKVKSKNHRIMIFQRKFQNKSSEELKHIINSKDYTQEAKIAAQELLKKIDNLNH